MPRSMGYRPYAGVHISVDLCTYPDVPRAINPGKNEADLFNGKTQPHSTDSHNHQAILCLYGIPKLLT